MMHVMSVISSGGACLDGPARNGFSVSKNTPARLPHFFFDTHGSFLLLFVDGHHSQPQAASSRPITFFPSFLWLEIQCVAQDLRCFSGLFLQFAEVVTLFFPILRRR
jgi:hypothetical protein